MKEFILQHAQLVILILFILYWSVPIVVIGLISKTKRFSRGVKSAFIILFIVLFTLITIYLFNYIDNEINTHIQK